jgi:UDP-N-acetylmuramyl pentapeptide phosphotransferase/UDP-N-acetylglucosamine-1-phosphate transferase
MNRFILILFIILTLSLSSQAGWFTNNDQPYQQQIHDLHIQVAQQAHQNQQMVVVIIILSTGVVIALLIGAAIGSKARKAAKEVEN